MQRREPWSLRRRMVMALLGFSLVLSVLVFAIGGYVHEHAEHAAWRSLLDTELTAIQSQAARDPHYHWQDTDTLRLYRLAEEGAIQAQLRGLHDGLHDNIRVDGRLSALMIRRSDALGRLALVLDIEDFHEMEAFAERSALMAGVVLLVVTGLAAWLGVGRLVRPLARLADDIARLRPGHGPQQVQVSTGGSSELYVIADALNDYLERNAKFVERERQFLTTASHELRTPVAVIGGAAELALGHADLPPRAAEQIRRVHETAQGMERLIQLLLVLAREPGKLAAMSEPIDVSRALQRVVEDHRHLLGDKQLSVEFGMLQPCTVTAPAGVVEAMIGNLLRNAVENSDSGVITVALGADCSVSIEDPGHGMSPEQVSAIYARLARKGGSEAGEGIGLELIARLCEHLGWALRLEPRVPKGTCARLCLQRME